MRKILCLYSETLPIIELIHNETFTVVYQQVSWVDKVDTIKGPISVKFPLMIC